MAHELAPEPTHKFPDSKSLFGFRPFEFVIDNCLILLKHLAEFSQEQVATCYGEKLLEFKKKRPKV